MSHCICLVCTSYEVIPDDCHQFSPFCNVTGFDGFCWHHCKFVCEGDTCYESNRRDFNV